MTAHTGLITKVLSFLDQHYATSEDTAFTAAKVAQVMREPEDAVSASLSAAINARHGSRLRRSKDGRQWRYWLSSRKAKYRKQQGDRGYRGKHVTRRAPRPNVTTTLEAPAIDSPFPVTVVVGVRIEVRDIGVTLSLEEARALSAQLSRAFPNPS